MIALLTALLGMHVWNESMFFVAQKDVTSDNDVFLTMALMWLVQG
jgi:hypothetical protein